MGEGIMDLSGSGKGPVANCYARDGTLCSTKQQRSSSL